MDMAIEIETRADHVVAICKALPPQWRVGQRDTLDTIEASVAHMVTLLHRKTNEIAALQLALADARTAKPTDEQSLADMIGRIAEMVEADTALEITGDGEIWVHFDGKAFEADQIGALEMLDAAGTLARSARRG